MAEKFLTGAKVYVDLALDFPGDVPKNLVATCCVKFPYGLVLNHIDVYSTHEGYTIVYPQLEGSEGCNEPRCDCRKPPYFFDNLAAIDLFERAVCETVRKSIEAAEKP